MISNNMIVHKDNITSSMNMALQVQQRRYYKSNKSHMTSPTKISYSKFEPCIGPIPLLLQIGGFAPLVSLAFAPSFAPLLALRMNKANRLERRNYKQKNMVNLSLTHEHNRDNISVHIFCLAPYVFILASGSIKPPLVAIMRLCSTMDVL
jgi:hypothetical protein